MRRVGGIEFDATAVEARNRNFHRMLVGGVGVEFRDPDGRVRGAQVRVLDFDNPEANFWFVVSCATAWQSQIRTALPSG